MRRFGLYCLLLIFLLPLAEAAPTFITHKVGATREKRDGKMTLYLRIPNRKRTAEATKGVLLICWWGGGDKLARERLTGDYYLADFCDKHNLTAVFFGVPKGGWDSTRNDWDIPAAQRMKMLASFRKSVTTFEEGMGELRERYKVPRGKYLGYGISGGAQWIHRYALARPQSFIGVHCHINSSYGVPNPGGRACLWLVTTGEQEAGYLRARQFYDKCREAQYPVMFLPLLNVGHKDTKEAQELGAAFFAYAIEKKAQWDRAFPLTAPQPPLNPDRAPWTKEFQDPAYIGDFINHEAFPLKWKKLIPKSQQVLLPTKAIAEKFGEIVE